MSSPASLWGACRSVWPCLRTANSPTSRTWACLITLLFPATTRTGPKKTGLDFPPFGFPSKEAAEGATVEGKAIPGLGDPNVPESNSLWVIDAADPAQPKVVAKVKTGVQVGDKSVGGSSPGAVVAGRDKVFVSNANQDSITILDAHSNQVEKTVLLEPADAVKGLRGVLPFGMALSPDEKRLYVACAGINAVAVLDTGSGKCWVTSQRRGSRRGLPSAPMARPFTWPTRRDLAPDPTAGRTFTRGRKELTLETSRMDSSPSSPSRTRANSNKPRRRCSRTTAL